VHARPPQAREDGVQVFAITSAANRVAASGTVLDGFQESVARPQGRLQWVSLPGLPTCYQLKTAGRIFSPFAAGGFLQVILGLASIRCCRWN
jgi:hypothetical protein